MTEKAKIILAGGAGYIGFYTVIEIFKKRDYDVISIDNYANSD